LPFLETFAPGDLHCAGIARPIGTAAVLPSSTRDLRHSPGKSSKFRLQVRYEQGVSFVCTSSDSAISAGQHLPKLREKPRFFANATHLQADIIRLTDARSAVT
jgi:hypothetical protein